MYTYIIVCKFVTFIHPDVLFFSRRSQFYVGDILPTFSSTQRNNKTFVYKGLENWFFSLFTLIHLVFSTTFFVCLFLLFIFFSISTTWEYWVKNLFFSMVKNKKISWWNICSVHLHYFLYQHHSGKVNARGIFSSFSFVKCSWRRNTSN